MIVEQILGSFYGEFGEVKYISVPEGATYHLIMHGQSAGDFSLDVQESDDTQSTTSTIANVPTTPNTIATMDIDSAGIGTDTPLRVDEDGTGTTSITIPLADGTTTFYKSPVVPTSLQQTSQTSLQQSLKEISHSSGTHGSGIVQTSFPTISSPPKPDLAYQPPSVLQYKNLTQRSSHATHSSLSSTSSQDIPDTIHGATHELLPTAAPIAPARKSFIHTAFDMFYKLWVATARESEQVVHIFYKL
jgi:hypothetical protein